MTRSFAFPLIIALSVATPSVASEPRLATHAYRPGEIIRIDARLGVQAVISFGQDELIENVAIGDSTNWQITPNKRANLLFLKPLSGKSQTNLTVVTDRYTYFFDLVTTTTRAPLYQLRFTYPDAPRSAPTSSVSALTEEESAIALGAQDDLPVDPAKLNFGWRTSGTSQLLPEKIYDDGRATYLSWSSKASIPALLTLDEKGIEGPVNYAVRGNMIVVDDVPAELVLRSGRSKAILTHIPPAPAADHARPAPIDEKK